MKVEILYIPQCPHYTEALANLSEVLRAEGLSVEIDEVEVGDIRMAEAAGFRGSPTIRIDGRDIEGEPKELSEFGMACRLYAGERQQGVPPRKMIRDAVRRNLRGWSK